jgi:polyisoprenoid-binding protein YceI
VVFDPDSGEASGGLVVATGSANTSHEGRDEDMHVKVLESDAYPEIAFRPTAIRGEIAREGESTVEIDGLFAIHGDEHPLTVEAVAVVDGDELAATVEFEVPYVSWGMKNPSKLLLKVAKQVQVRIRGVGTLTPVADGSSSAGS